MPRVVIVGWPGAGKTTLATQMGGGRSTDDVWHLGWSEASDEVAKWFDAEGDWIVEGVAVPRALRKWKAQNPGKPPPIDKIIHLQKRDQNNIRAVGMGKAVDTVMSELMPWLENVEVEQQ